MSTVEQALLMYDRIKSRTIAKKCGVERVALDSRRVQGYSLHMASTQSTGLAEESIAETYLTEIVTFE